MIKIAMAGVYVDDVRKAHAFYTDVLGFETRNDIDMGEALYVMLGAAGAQPDVELLLEPGDSPIAQNYTRALSEAGLPCIVFSVDDLRAEYERLSGLGVYFPSRHRTRTSADRRTRRHGRNLVQLVQPLRT